MPLPRNFLVTSVLTLASTMAQSDTLMEIYELALMNDPQLSAAEAAYLAGKEAKNIGRAGLLPSISATASYTETENDVDSLQPIENELLASPEGEIDTDSTTAVVALRQPLFDMSAWFDFKQGKQLSEQAQYTYAAEKQQEIIRVADAYFNVLRNAENLDTVIAEEAAVSRQLQQTRERFEVGLLPITDVHEAQAAYDDALVNTLEARGDLNIAFEALEVFTGRRHQELAGLAASFPTADPEKAEQWVSLARENNYQLKAQHYAVQAAEANAKARKSEHLPTITGQASYTNTDADGTSLGFPSSDELEGNQVSIELSMPIFTGGLTSANRRQANQLAIQAQQNYLASVRSIVQQARSQHLQVVTNVARIKARQQAITSANSALEATQAGYDVGTRNIVDVLNAQRVLFQAKRAYANARYDYISSLLLLKQVSGQLTPEDLQLLNRWLKPSLKIVRVAVQQ